MTIGAAGIASKANHKYIQPHTLIADNIVSHSITPELFLKILDHNGGLESFTVDVQTHYYHENMVLEANSKGDMKCYITQQIERCVDADLGKGMEFVGENRTTLSPTLFPLSKTYHHERQSIILSTKELQLEILLIGIMTPCERVANLKDIIDNIAAPEDDPDYLSLSYKIYVNDSIEHYMRQFKLKFF